MRRFWKNRKGYVMAYVTILIGTVAIPMLLLAVEITRAMFVEVQRQFSGIGCGQSHELMKRMRRSI
jgi:hypothetical protein